MAGSLSYKDILISIIRVVREKALTFNQIYNMFGDRLADDYEKETGKNIRY